MQPAIDNQRYSQATVGHRCQKIKHIINGIEPKTNKSQLIFNI